MLGVTVAAKPALGPELLDSRIAFCISDIGGRRLVDRRRHAWFTAAPDLRSSVGVRLEVHHGPASDDLAADFGGCGLCERPDQRLGERGRENDGAATPGLRHCGQTVDAEDPPQLDQVARDRERSIR